MILNLEECFFSLEIILKQIFPQIQVQMGKHQFRLYVDDSKIGPASVYANEKQLSGTTSNTIKDRRSDMIHKLLFGIGYCTL